MKTTMTSTIFLPIVAMLTLGVASVYAQDSVKMTFSGTSENSANNLLQPGTFTPNDEDNFAGIGSLGSFTLRNIRAMSDTPTPSSTCSGPNLGHFVEPAGGGIFRFGDGSLLYMNLTQGDDCINFAANVAHCILSFQITGGTGRFKNASGTLTLTETVVAVLSDYDNNPLYFAATGKLAGRVSGVSEERSQDDGQ
jgi:hypothetical protein